MGILGKVGQGGSSSSEGFVCLYMRGCHLFIWVCLLVFKNNPASTQPQPTISPPVLSALRPKCSLLPSAVVTPLEQCTHELAQCHNNLQQ